MRGFRFLDSRFRGDERGGVCERVRRLIPSPAGLERGDLRHAGSGAPRDNHPAKIRIRNRRRPFMIPRKKRWGITTHHFSDGRMMLLASGHGEAAQAIRSSSVRACSVRAAARSGYLKRVCSRGPETDGRLRPGRPLQRSLRGRAGGPVLSELENPRRTQSSWRRCKNCARGVETSPY